MKRFLIAVAAGLLVPAAAFAQDAAKPASPVSEFVRQTVARQAPNLIGAAEEMPADKYSFHPTPQQMTFGHLVMHISGSNYFLCSKISGVAAPEHEKIADTDPKDKLVAGLKASFDFCTQSLANVDDSKLRDEIDFFGGRKVTRAAAMIILTNDFADHYSAAAMYLRLNGLLPPTAQKKSE
ncbi:MAG: DinB family protein [Candidatus Acidiferrales bacterium]